MRTGKKVTLPGILAAALFCSIPVFAQSPAPPVTGLVSWWRGEGNANDSADSNNGSALNGAGYSPGAFGTGFFFDGVNDHVRIADSPNLRLTTAFTLAAWVNPASSGSYDEILSICARRPWLYVRYSPGRTKLCCDKSKWRFGCECTYNLNNPP